MIVPRQGYAVVRSRYARGGVPLPVTLLQAGATRFLPQQRQERRNVLYSKRGAVEALYRKSAVVADLGNPLRKLTRAVQAVMFESDTVEESLCYNSPGLSARTMWQCDNDADWEEVWHDLLRTLTPAPCSSNTVIGCVSICTVESG
jgi:hypothetical protein